MTYSVKSIFYTLQGEGANVGRPAVFCRFAGCNLWSGREEDRASAECSFCDTDFVGTDGDGGGQFKTAQDLAQAVRATWPESTSGQYHPLVVATGGEPLLQLNGDLVEALHEVGMEIAVETNGTISPPAGLDWICVSPKAGTELVVRSGNELKLVYPQEGVDPETYLGLNFFNHFLQPMDGPDLEENTKKTVQYCLEHPQWRLSVQVHKIIGIP
jgi:7-carboxy-7-deazaguanine synthase (Cx14CxxC type)